MNLFVRPSRGGWEGNRRKKKEKGKKGKEKEEVEKEKPTGPLFTLSPFLLPAQKTPQKIQKERGGDK